MTIEVDNEAIDNLLTAKVEAVEVILAKPLPKNGFRFHHM
jgi:hypothetical protein